MTDLDLDEDTIADQGGPVAAVADGAASTGANVEVDEDLGDTDERIPDRAERNADGSITLPLLYPQTLSIKKDGKTREERYAKLTFHRLNGADQRAIAAASDETSAVVAFARSTRMMQARMNVLFDKLDMADIADASRILNSFLPSGRRTGRRG